MDANRELSFIFFIVTIISMELKHIKKKTIKLSIIFLFCLSALIFSGGYFYLRQSLSPLDGKIKLFGLSKDVDIYRDENGIPHIFAKNRVDAHRALGFLMASERLFQMEISRRLASGELAEIIGEKAIASDKMFRSLRIRQSMKDLVEFKMKNHLFDPYMQKDLEAYFEGINFFQSTQPLPIEFKILGIKPRPFSIVDAYTFVGLMSFNFAVATTQDPLLTNLEKRLGPNLVNQLRVENVETKKSKLMTVKNEVFTQSKVHELVSYLETGFPIFEGSNGWLLAKSRTENGQNLLANDPHISFPQPQIWFEASIHTPEYENYGHFLSMLPFPVLSHNYNRAFGLTMSLTDDMDLYKENIEGDNYKFKNQTFSLIHDHQIIKVKGQNDVVLDLKITGHGPVLDEILSEKNLSLKWSYLDKRNDPLSAFYEMNHAKNMQEFKTGVSHGISPGLNVLYADKENIAWWMFGLVSLKADNSRSDFILDGSSGKDEYLGELKFDERPNLVNPKSGIIVSANYRPLNFPKNQRGDWQPEDRFYSLTTLLSKKEKWNEEEIKELQTLSLNLENKRVLDKLLQEIDVNTENAKFVDILRKWDFVSDKESIAPSLYFLLVDKIGFKLLSKKLSHDELETFSKISESYSFNKRMVLNESGPWWELENRHKLINLAFNETIEELKESFGKDETNWKWGRLHTIEFVHPIGKIWPLNYIFNLGPYPLSGANQDINNQKSAAYKGKFEVRVGPSTRRIISFAHLDSTLGILPIGESGHLLSPYYKNQLERYLDGKYRPMYLSKELILKNQTHHLKLMSE